MAPGSGGPSAAIRLGPPRCGCGARRVGQRGARCGRSADRWGLCCGPVASGVQKAPSPRWERRLPEGLGPGGACGRGTETGGDRAGRGGRGGAGGPSSRPRKGLSAARGGAGVWRAALPAAAIRVGAAGPEEGCGFGARLPDCGRLPSFPRSSPEAAAASASHRSITNAISNVVERRWRLQC